jgi:hypothetical protein
MMMSEALHDEFLLEGHVKRTVIIFALIAVKSIAFSVSPPEL